MVQRYSKSGEMQNKLEFILIWEKNKEASFLETSYSLLGYPDSNQERQDQNLQCYHYTIPQTYYHSALLLNCGCKGTAFS